MKLFISYANEDKKLAARVTAALEAEGHEPFFADRELSQHDAFNPVLRDHIDGSDGFVFLISPASVKSGKYTLNELEQAVRKWRPPTGHIFSFFARRTASRTLPALLPQTTIETTEGDLPAHIVSVIARSFGKGPDRIAAEAARELIGAVRALDNAVRDHLAALSVFDSSCPPRVRNEHIDKLVAFARRTHLLRNVRAALAVSSELINWNEPKRDILFDAHRLAESYLLSLGGPQSPTPFGSDKDMIAFFQKVRRAKSEADTAEVREWSEKMMRFDQEQRISAIEQSCDTLLASLNARANWRDRAPRDR